MCEPNAHRVEESGGEGLPSGRYITEIVSGWKYRDHKSWTSTNSMTYRISWRRLLQIFILCQAISEAKQLFPCRTKLTWVNGIAHLPEHMEDPTYVISSAFGHVKVDYCHNPSAMTSESDYIGFVKDGIQASGHQMGRVTKEVDTLVEHLRDALVKVGKSGKVIHIAHSQGSVITWLAAKRLTPEECRRIEVIR